MIVLDTKVISELWKVDPDSNVLAWIDAQAIETLYLSAVTVAELRYGLATMPHEKGSGSFNFSGPPHCALQRRSTSR